MEFALRGFEARRLGVDDAAALQGLLERCAAYFRGADGRAPDKHAGLERISDSLGDAQVELHGFSQAGRLVALLELRLDEPTQEAATVVLLLVDPGARRQGLGREIVEALVQQLQGEGFRALHLGVQDGEDTAHAFWASLGFSPNHTVPGITRYWRVIDS